MMVGAVPGRAVTIQSRSGAAAVSNYCFDGSGGSGCHPEALFSSPCPSESVGQRGELTGSVAVKLAGHGCTQKRLHGEGQKQCGGGVHLS